MCLFLLTSSGTLVIFFFNDTATTEIYTLSLHDALPICAHHQRRRARHSDPDWQRCRAFPDRKSTRLNSSHGYISYAVFCLKKKNKLHIMFQSGSVLHSQSADSLIICYAFVNRATLSIVA